MTALINDVEYKFYSGGSRGPFYQAMFETNEERSEARESLEKARESIGGKIGGKISGKISYYGFFDEYNKLISPIGNFPESAGGYGLGITEKGVKNLKEFGVAKIMKGGGKRRKTKRRKSSKRKSKRRKTRRKSKR